MGPLANPFALILNESEDTNEQEKEQAAGLVASRSRTKFF